LPNQPENRKMVRGKPYISINKATIKAENAPKLRQSVFVWGLKKLNANMMNTVEFRMTSPHRP